MNNMHKESKANDTTWTTIGPEDMQGISRTFNATNLEQSLKIAEIAMSIIESQGHAKSSIITFNDRECNISLHVVIEGTPTPSDYAVAKMIDKAIENE